DAVRRDAGREKDGHICPLLQEERAKRRRTLSQGDSLLGHRLNRLLLLLAHRTTFGFVYLSSRYVVALTVYPARVRVRYVSTDPSGRTPRSADPIREMSSALIRSTCFPTRD